nr:hypothetical protein CFP56_69974 [Quercus suber]
MCFQCGKVGHDAIRCPHLYEGNTETKPYGEWLRAGNRMFSSKPQSTDDSPPRHSPALTRQTSHQTPSLIMIDVTSNPEGLSFLLQKATETRKLRGLLSC